MAKSRMDTLGFILKLSGMICLFVGMVLAGYISASTPGHKEQNDIVMDGFGGAYLGIGVTLIIFEILNMVACYGAGWMSDADLDITWQAINGALALCVGFMYCKPVDDSTQYCSSPLSCSRTRYALQIISMLLALISGVLFILAAIFTKSGK